MLQHNLDEKNYYQDKEYYSSSMLKDFNKCPYYFRDKHILQNFTEEEKDAFVFGRAVDTILTEGIESFNAKFEVVARRSKDAEKEQLTQSQYENVTECVDALRRQPLYQKLSFQKQGFQSIFIAEIDGVKRKGRLDYIDLENKIINDVKTTADLFDFDVKKWGYDRSMANYREIVAINTNTKPEEWSVYLSVVEKKKGIKKCRMFYFDNTVLDIAEMKNKIDFKKLDLAMSSGNFDHDESEYKDESYQCFAHDTCPLFLQRKYVKIY